MSASSEQVSGAHSGGLQHDGVAGRERGTDLPRRQHERRVPRGDQRRHPRRLVPDLVVAHRAGDHRRIRVEPPRVLGEELDVVRAAVDDVLRVGEQERAVVLGLDRRERRRSRSRIFSAKRRRISPRPFGPSAAHAGKARRAARTAASTSAAPPAATSARCAPSIGELSAKRSPDTDGTRSPPIQWSGRDLDAGDGRGPCSPGRAHGAVRPSTASTSEGSSAISRCAHDVRDLQRAGRRREVEALVQLVAPAERAPGEVPCRPEQPDPLAGAHPGGTLVVALDQVARARDRRAPPPSGSRAGCGRR